MNKVILIGRLTRDPELRTTPTNLSVATFSIAVSRPFSPQNGGTPEADFINCVVWRRQAENLAKYCHKGSQIAIEGRIQSRSYNANDGSKRYVTEVMCDNITFLGSKMDNQGNPTGFDNNNSYGNPMSEQPDMNSIPTTDITEDPFKDFGEEITLSDDDLPF
ncbi:MAG: single-stranded DNA-binding protein [Ruminococcus sp.]|nr:single-stranded DNA-binding protein [Ruminococcus sp.]